MKKIVYSPEFKGQVLIKVNDRKGRTIPEVAAELNLAVGTLKGWMQDARRAQHQVVPDHKRAADWTMAERLTALQETYLFDESKLAAWCRERGLFAHQLQQWRTDFCSPNPRAAQQEAQHEVRVLKHENQQLQKQLTRKEKALAETAALLVLQKKFQALWEGEGE